MLGRTAQAGAHNGIDDPGLDRLRGVLGAWRESLIDMGGRNRLLNFRHTRTSTLEIKSPGAGSLLAGLASGWDFERIAVPGEGAGDSADGVSLAKGSGSPASVATGIVTQKSTQALLDRSLTQLRSTSGRMYNDYGLWVLWLGVGTVEWREEGAHEGSRAPLVLVPAELTRDRSGRVRLRAAEQQDPVHNPALAVKLGQLGVDWSAVAAVDCMDPAQVVGRAHEAVAGQQGWSVDDGVVLGLFASHKEAMYQDLKENEEAILGNPLIRAIGLGPESGLPDDLIGFEPPALDRIDELQLPERTPLVLDADASQRQCIAAAMEKRSFVMSGPPGTGKSQTITNMIAALMHAGRSVLFVSEKAAALDVVRNRLTDVGLGDFVLALHSGDTAKKAVAQELARVLMTEVRAKGAPEHELAEARRLREELSAHAAAMNEEREPLGRSLYEVLGRIALLDQQDAPRLALGTTGVGRTLALSAAHLQEALGAAGSMARSWRPVTEGAGFAWRGLRHIGSEPGSGPSEGSGSGSDAGSAPAGGGPLARLEEARAALQALRFAAERRPLAGCTAEPLRARDVERLAAELRPGPPARTSGNGNGNGSGPAGTRTGGSLPEDPFPLVVRVAGAFGLDEPHDPAGVLALCELADLAGAPHRPLEHWFDAPVRRAAGNAAEVLRAAFAAAGAARAAAEDAFGPQVLAYEPLAELVRRFDEEHHGLASRFKGQFRTDKEAVAGLAVNGTWTKELRARLGQALAWQRAQAEAVRLTAEHRELLGVYLPADGTRFGPLDEALATAGRIGELAPGARLRELREQLAHGSAPGDHVRHQVQAVRAALADWAEAAERRGAAWSAASAALHGLFDEARKSALHPALTGTLADADRVLGVLGADHSGPEEWRAHHDGLAVLARLGLAELAATAAERRIGAAEFPGGVERALLQRWADAVLASDQRLRTTRSTDLDARVADFRAADRGLVAAAGGAVIAACNGRKPRAFGGGGSGIIIREAEKKTRHMAVRELLGKAREAAQAVKPCFMMSPLSVSQFLPADYRFDVVIFDEASQVRPGDAVNCVYRGRSLIVAGDEKQLPPTSFFDSSIGDEGGDYDEDVPDSFESLLDACKAGAMRALPLRWHYRSRHEDLITFSNRSFYRNSMVTFPGAREHGPDVGVAFVEAAGTYDRGGRRDNRIEAEVVAQRVLHHFDTRPGQSLGVVALSQAQAAAIEESVQRARLARPDLDDRFTENRLDGFFVKNLESVQGDERDVMIMSIGYGPDEHGKLTQTFGPMNNKDGGWRRLNVAVTRARHRMEVVASFHGGQLKDSDNRSIQDLKRYLQYAEHGPCVLAQDHGTADAEPDSPFEESVLAVLRGWGHDVRPQVGVAGYRIDLGLRHPAAPGAYALGIECDGAMYHSSRAARDRDRLRQEVLEGLGWTLYRIWGTDWYRNRPEAERRLKDAVEAAVAVDPFARPTVVRTPPPAPSADGPDDTAEPWTGIGIGGGTGTGSGAGAAGGPGSGSVAHRIPAPRPEPERVLVSRVPEREWSRTYTTAQVSVDTTWAAPEMHTPEARPRLHELLARIVETEGPLHEELLVQRAREAWGLGRSGKRIVDNAQYVLRELERQGAVERADAFVDIAGREIRWARTAQDENPRKIAHVPPGERQLALRELTLECPGMSQEELLQQAREFFGWKRMGSDIRTALESDVAQLLAQGRLTGSTDRLAARR
ncbi:DUF3320 domain-containing protein [Streptomyces sp. NBC_00435]|uniref:DUF3320 domain-containing protein n=1 Tax=Streptomyces sp. NBC_00435 TaxID=2903649 RepID=UPI002E1C3ED6